MDKILIRTVIEAANAVTDKLRGLAFHVSGDEIVVLLPPAMKQDEIYDALNRVQLNIMEQVQGRYVLAKLNAASARSKRAGLKRLSRYSRFVMTANLLVKTGSIVAEETFVVLNKKIHETNEAVFKEVLSILEKSRVTAEIETDVLVPWAPAGAVKISQIPDISHLSAAERLTLAVSEAEYTQRLAKETKELVRVGLSPRPTRAPMQLAGDGRRLEKERQKIRLQMLKADIALEALEEVNPAIRREYLFSIISNVLKDTRTGLVNIVRGPPDTFYVILKQINLSVKLIKICPYYVPSSAEKEKAFIAKSGSRDIHRVADAGGEILHFGFKVVNDTLDHHIGDEVILALNIALFDTLTKKTFKELKRISVADVLKAITNVQQKTNAKISALGFETRLEAATIYAGETGNNIGEAISKLDMLAQARNSVPVITSRQGAVVRDYVTVRKNRRVARALDQEIALTEALKRERLRIR